MKTKHLIVTLLVIVTIFVTRGFYVTQSVRESFQTSLHQFEIVCNVTDPLGEVYGFGVLEPQVKAIHGIMSLQDLATTLKDATLREKELLETYATLIKGNETANDRDLFIRADAMRLYMSKIEYLCSANKLEDIHKTLYSGEAYVAFDSLFKCLDRITDEKLRNAANEKVRADKALVNFEQVMTLSGVLILILGVLVVKYREPVPVYRAKKSVIKKRPTRRDE